jgi:hypothetical protein
VNLTLGLVTVAVAVLGAGGVLLKSGTDPDFFRVNKLGTDPDFRSAQPQSAVLFRFATPMTSQVDSP